MIGILIPGVPLITGGPIQTNNVLADVNNPKNVNTITLFLTEMIPDDCGVALYYSVPPYESQKFIGCVCNQRPSDTFNTGWTIDPNVNIYPTIKIGAQIDKLLNIENLYNQKSQVDLRQEFAKKIGQNLFDYMKMYNQSNNPNDNLLIVPMKSLDDWYEKIMNKYKLDPNFLMSGNN